MSFNAEELASIRSYLERRFKNPGFTLKKRDKADDSIEVLLDNEFIGVIYKDDEDPENLSYDFNMPILDIDLADAA